MTPRPVARREARLSRAVAAAAGAGARAHADRVLAIAAEVHARGYAVVPILAGARLERLQDGMAHIFAALGRLDAEAQARVKQYDYRAVRKHTHTLLYSINSKPKTQKKKLC